MNGGKPTWPYVIHGHYADAGEIAAHLSGALSVPMVLTGHSLGRNKFEQLLKQGRLSREAINATYKIMRRIEAEELGVDAAEMVVTSTRQEIEEQWGLYDGFDLKLERKLRVRRRRGVSGLGRHMPRMVVCTMSLFSGVYFVKQCSLLLKCIVLLNLIIRLFHQAWTSAMLKCKTQWKVKGTSSP